MKIKQGTALKFGELMDGEAFVFVGDWQPQDSLRPHGLFMKVGSNSPSSFVSLDGGQLWTTDSSTLYSNQTVRRVNAHIVVENE